MDTVQHFRQEETRRDKAARPSVRPSVRYTVARLFVYLHYYHRVSLRDPGVAASISLPSNGATAAAIAVASREARRPDSGDRRGACPSLGGADDCRGENQYGAGSVKITMRRGFLLSSQRVRTRLNFGVWLVSGYAHVFVLLSVVVVTFPVFSTCRRLCRRRRLFHDGNKQFLHYLLNTR